MPIQADGVEKPEFVRTQAADFRRLLGVTIHQLFKRTVPTKNFPKSNKLRVREWLRKDIRHLEIGPDSRQLDITAQALITHKMVKFCNVFCSLVVYRIFGYLDASLVVLHYGYTTRGDVEIFE